MNKKEKKKLVVATALITMFATLVAIVGLQYIFGIRFIALGTYKEMSNIAKDFNKFYAMEKNVKENYLWKKDADFNKAMEDAYKAYLSSLGDPYTRYLDKDETAALSEMLENKYTGIGLYIGQDKDGQIQAVEVIKDGPAYSAGIKDLDVIKAIDGKTYDNTKDAAKAMRGPEGSSVNLTILRDGKTFDVSVVRSQISQSTVEYRILDGKIGYIQIKSFGENTSEEFDKAISYLESKDVKSAVVDLRNNPGGLLDESIKIADRLIGDGLITYTEDNKGKKEEFKAHKGHSDINLVLLINENTASAAEVLAAAIKDHGGTLVGVKSYGKGIIQETIMYKDNTALSVTTKQYFSPKGDVIHKKGIEPTVEVSLPSDATDDLQLNKAIEILNSNK